MKRSGAGVWRGEGTETHQRSGSATPPRTAAGAAKFLGMFLVGFLWAAPAAEAQQPGKVPRVGFLSLSSSSSSGYYLEALRQALRERGYVEGKSIAFEVRWADGKIERLPELASELVRRQVDLIVTHTTPAAFAAKNATGTIPIVMATAGDPVGTGLVASLARPGGNITGLSLLLSELTEKRLDLLKQAIPRASRVAFLGNSANPPEVLGLKESQRVARTLRVTVHFIDMRTHPTNFETAFAAMVREGAHALIVTESQTNRDHRERIAALALSHRLPAIAGNAEFAQAGILMAYGPSYVDFFRRAAAYVDKILKGREPADLPVEQPRRFELVINLKTAKALGLTFPPSVLVRADQVIQ